MDNIANEIKLLRKTLSHTTLMFFMIHENSPNYQYMESDILSQLLKELRELSGIEEVNTHDGENDPI